MTTTISTTDLGDVTGGNMAGSIGQGLGFGAGVAVTAGLALVPGWNKQVPGAPAGFEKRHESVVGPQIEAHARGMSPGVAHDFVAGLGTGATAAPGWSFRHGI